MKRFLFCSLILTMSLSAYSLDEEWRGFKIQNGCALYDTKDFFKLFPGNICIFLNDGSFISAGTKAIRRISREEKILWEKEGHFHHQVNLTPDGKRLLTLTSEIVERNKRKERDDVIRIFDLSGNELYRRSVIDLLPEVNLSPLDWSKAPETVALGAEIETSHVNSIYEIPANPQENKTAYMKSGNIIINSSRLGIFILSPDLRKILYHKQFPQSFFHALHDVQVGGDGNFLLFNNNVPTDGFHRWSAIQKYDPVKEKITFEWTSLPKEMFYSPACGGVQEIGKYIFFNHITNGGYVYSKKEKKVIGAVPGYNGNPKEVLPTQQLKFVDVSEFLKHHLN